MRSLFIASFSIVILTVFSANAAELPINLVRLELRDRSITVTSTSDGIRYTIRAQDGTIIAAQLNEADLQAKHPEVYEKVKEAIAAPSENYLMLAP
jgi:hypothetical protein